MKKTVFLLCSLLLFIPTFHAQEVIPLHNVKRSDKELKLSNYASRIINIPLETNDELLLSDALQAIYTGEDIIISDTKDFSFYRFDKTGRFLNKIGRQGNGPGEYNKSFAFKVDMANKQVYIVDTFLRAIYVYDFSGKFLRKMPLEYKTNGFDFMGNNIVYYNFDYYDSNVYELILADTNGKTIKKTKNDIPSSKAKLILDLPQFYTYNKEVYYRNQVDNTIFRISPELKKTAVWLLDCGNKKNKREGNQYENESKERSTIVIKNVKETPKYLIITYYHDEALHHVIYHKAVKTLEYAGGKEKEKSLTDDLSGGPSFALKFGTFTPQEATDNTLVSILQTSQIPDIEKYKGSAFYNAVSKRFEPDGNPIIRIVELK